MKKPTKTEIFKTAKLLLSEYLKSEASVNWSDKGHSVKKWDDLKDYNKENFLFFAEWHLKNRGKK